MPEAGFDHLVRLVRTGVDLCTRVRAAAGYVRRQERKQKRGADEPQLPRDGGTEGRPHSLRTHVQDAADLVHKARALFGAGDISGAKRTVEDVGAQLDGIRDAAEGMIGEQALLRVVASVGTQMAAFVHEVNALLGASRTIENAMQQMVADESLSRQHRRRLTSTIAAMTDLRLGLERQASYLTDVITPDARRRRSKQRLSDRFNAAVSLVAHQAERRSIREILNEIGADVFSQPMFAAEVTTVFANLLTNAVKAAGKGGIVKASATQDTSGVRLRIENTGVAVKLADGERWFRPFESTTVEVHPVLGQGMGLGLPISRSILSE